MTKIPVTWGMVTELSIESAYYKENDYIAFYNLKIKSGVNTVENVPTFYAELGSYVKIVERLVVLEYHPCQAEITASYVFKVERNSSRKTDIWIPRVLYQYGDPCYDAWKSVWDYHQRYFKGGTWGTLYVEVYDWWGSKLYSYRGGGWSIIYNKYTDVPLDQLPPPPDPPPEEELPPPPPPPSQITTAYNVVGSFNINTIDSYTLMQKTPAIERKKTAFPWYLLLIPIFFIRDLEENKNR